MNERNFFYHQRFSSPPLRRQKPNIAFFRATDCWIWVIFLCFCKSKLIAQMFSTINNEKRIFLCACFFMLSSFLLLSSVHFSWMWFNKIPHFVAFSCFMRIVKLTFLLLSLLLIANDNEEWHFSYKRLSAYLYEI
jgi:hypothetical protein